jgi:SAM-dependent methyltransferase
MFGNQVLNTILAPWAARALYTASRMKVFDHLDKKPMTAKELSGRTGGVQHFLEALLDACAGMGLLEQEQGRYSNSYLARIYLVEGNPLYLGDFIDVIDSEAEGWEQLYDLVTDPGFAGRGNLKRETSAHRFTMAMNNLAMQGEADALAGALDLSKCKNMVDAGCGSGIYSVTLCLRFPRLHATLLDRAEVLETTRKVVETVDLQDRIQFRAADITTDDFGKGLDAVLLSDVIYGREPICLAILESAHRALAPGGTLIIRGYYPDFENPTSPFGSLFTLAQVISDPQRPVITTSRLCQWLETFKFKNIRVAPLTVRSTLITAVR